MLSLLYQDTNVRMRASPLGLSHTISFHEIRVPDKNVLHVDKKKRRGPTSLFQFVVFSILLLRARLLEPI